MCELFGLCAAEKIRANEYLKTFFSHSDEHRDGWGLAVFRGRGVSMEKEPVKALDSVYLRQRLSSDVTGADMVAHIRLATIGEIKYHNCHPFIWDDESGRTWTLIHNGTLFDTELTAPYFSMQEGTTDSEGVLLYIIDRVNEESRRLKRELLSEERLSLIDDVTVKLSKDNKFNMILYDGEIMYVHTNYRGSLFFLEEKGKYIFSTKPLDEGNWEAHPMNRMNAYSKGKKIFEGTDHSNEFHDEDHDLTLQYWTYSGL